MVTLFRADSPRTPMRRSWAGTGKRENAPRTSELVSIGAGARIRTGGLPFTRRLLCLLSYTGGRLCAW